jgi:hypothetical protein
MNMTWKKYQPERTDFLINNDWGIPVDQMSTEDAKSSGRILFHKRWVTKEERKLLREEHATYQSILIIGYLLIAMTLCIVINSGEIFQGGIISTSFAVAYGFVMLAAGIGLIKFRRFARNIAIFVFLSFLVLPFTPLLGDDKGSPLIIILGITGLYYLLRKTARKIFVAPSGEKTDDTKYKSPVIRKVIYAGLLLLVFFAGYFVYDMSQAKRMAADVCIGATPGMPLEDFLSKLPEKDYRIIRRAEYLMMVPKRGMGRNSCTVSHDGQKITGSKTGYKD